MKPLILFAAVGVLWLPALATADGFNISARGSTLGLGGEVGYAFNRYVNLRVGLNSFSYDYDTTEDGIDYNFDLDLRSTAVLLDLHPFAGRFRLTGGLLDNRNELNGRAEAADSYEIGDENYTSEEIGTLFGHATLGDDNPLYFGLGFSQPLADSGWGFGFDVGLVMLGDSEVSLIPAGGTLVGSPAFQADVEVEEQRAEEDLNDSFETYPVAAIGVTFQF